jgi:tryptophan 2,3-dioxygenase
MAQDSGPGSDAAVDLSDERIHWDPGLSYSSYLCLEPLLALQRPRSDAHDELLFITIHQASELWMKLAAAELAAAMREISRGELSPALKMLSRVARIQALLTQSWGVLATMTPSDYSAFRGALGESSGFQSYQYRQLEFRLGNKNPATINVHRNNPAAYAMLAQVLAEPSIYDLVLRWMQRNGFDIPIEHVERDFSVPYVASPAVERAWLKVYSDPQRHWDLYELGEKLVDVEEQFQVWRFSHMKTVERIIGYKRGTGGTSGVSYLVRALDLRFFPELWSVRTSL